MKKRILAFLLCILLATPAFANTTFYNYLLPTVGASQNTWGTLLNTILNTVDSNIWSAANGTVIGVTTASSATTITLANPLNNIQNITFTAGSQNLVLPPMNATKSLVLGGTITVNNKGSNAFSVVAQDGSTSVVSSLAPGQSVYLTLLTNGTANGTFQVNGPYLANGQPASFTTLNTSGATTLGSTLGVTGAATLSSTLAVTGNSTLSGFVGINSSPTGYQLNVVQAGAGEAYFGSTGSFSGQIIVDNAAGAQGSNLVLQNAGVSKWTVGTTQSSTPDFNVVDNVTPSTVIRAATNGNLTLGRAQNVIIDNAGNLSVGGNLTVTGTYPSPTAAQGASLVLIQAQTVSGAASVIFTSIPASYDQYVLKLTNVVPATAAVSLYLTFSEDNGSTYKSSGYPTGTVHNASTSGNSSAAAQIDLGGNTQSNTSTNGYSGTINLSGLASSTLHKFVDGTGIFFDSAGTFTAANVAGGYTADTGVINALKIAESAGNLTGKVALYGVKNN